MTPNLRWESDEKRTNDRDGITKRETEMDLILFWSCEVRTMFVFWGRTES